MFKKLIPITFLSLILSSINFYSQNIERILIDFGSLNSSAPWINFRNFTSGELVNLTNIHSENSGIKLKITDAFNNINTNGTESPNPVLGIPSTASGDSFLGNTINWGGDIEPTGGFVLSNLNPEKEYTLTIFASREAKDNRESQYICKGANTDTSYLNVSGNVNDVVVFNTFPANDSTIEIIASAGPNNNNPYKFYYMGLIIIEYESEPIYNSKVTLIKPNGGEFWQAGRDVKIKWENSTQSTAFLEYSIDNGFNWVEIDTIESFKKSYEWTVPNTVSQNCLVRITAGLLIDESDSEFEISEDSTFMCAVVIGSSTAEGIGPTNPDSAWVNRYKNAFYQNDTRIKVLNLAKGGYTTYNLLPTGDTTGSAVGITVDTMRNISRALKYNPKAVIVNLPSNDAARNLPLQNTLFNFDKIVSKSLESDVPIWVCSSQPINFSNPDQLQLQKDLRDSIFAKYGEYSVDFWNGLAKPNGNIIDIYNSGDGIHLNNAAHKILFERVYSKIDLDSLFNYITLAVEESKFTPLELEASIYPNPFNISTNIKYIIPISGHVNIKVYNILGQEIKLLVNQKLHKGNHNIVWNGTDSLNRIVSSGTYFIVIKNETFIEVIKGMVVK